MPKRGRGKPVPWKNGSERAVSWTRPRGQSLALLFLVVVAAFALGATMGPGLARAASDPAGLFTSARRSIRRGVVGGVLRAAGSFGSLGSGTRVKLFIASYKEDALLEELLESVIASDVMLFDTQVHVINNNPVPLRQRVGFKVPKLVAVHDRALTEPGGLGFPSRTWNQALMSGFRSLDQPDADIVVVLHADTQLGTDWFQVVATHLANCSLATYGAGDQIVVYTPEALRRIGLWDERFSSMSHHEADYFLRARLYAADASCIHDFSHGRVHRRQDGVFRIFARNVEPGNSRTGSPAYTERIQARDFDSAMLGLFQAKWGALPSRDWNVHEALLQSAVDRPPALRTEMTYPKFESGLANKSKLGYRVASGG